MTINLRVSLVRNSIQKCKLSSKQRCGSWAKCGIHNDGKEIYIVSQIYPQDEHERSELAFMDATVIDGATNHSNLKEFQNSVLLSIEPLKRVEVVGSVELTFFVNMEFFTKFKRIPSVYTMLDIAREVLQELGLTRTCTVRNLKELIRCGINAIEMNAGTCAKDCYYKITDDTDIRIADVRFEATVSTIDTFYTVGLEPILHNLNNLLEQRKYIRSLVCLNALIVGAEGCGKSSVIAHWVKQQNINYFKISMENILGQYPGESETKLRSLFNAVRTFVLAFSPKEPTIIHIDDIQLLCPATKIANKDNGNVFRLSSQLCTLLDSFNNEKIGVICLATTSDVKLLHKSLRSPGRFQQEITIETLNEETRKQLFLLLYNKSFPQQSLPEELINTIVLQTSGYVISDLMLLLNGIEQRALHLKSSNIKEIILEVLKKSKPSSLRGTVVTVIKPEAGFESIGGMQKLKNHLKHSILAGLSEAQAYKRFRLKLPKGILLYGPPGCAKTTIAKCLAAEAKMAFIAASGADIYSPYVGSSEKFLSKLFDTARKHAPCLIFLDEIDSLVGTRCVGGANSSNDVQTRILSTLLTEMDGIVQTRIATKAYILVVAATNRPNMIDDALLRPGRFDQLIHVPAPDHQSRLSILELLSIRMPFSNDCNLEEIAAVTRNYSGADICNLCNEAAMRAFQRDFNTEEIQKIDFEIVLEKQKPSLSQSQIDSYDIFKKGRLK